ncbi:MAG: hypothetical protein AB1491_10205 [Thermodesulfobacteriota bacterium]
MKKYPSRKRTVLWSILSGLIFLGIIYGAWAAQAFKTKWTIINYLATIDLQIMDGKLVFTPPKKFLKQYFFTPDPAQNALAPGLAPKMDGILYKVCSILPNCPKNQPYLKIFLLQDCQQVNQRLQVFSPFHDNPASACFGFFTAQANAIFVSLEDLSAGVLAHEMTHFLLSQFNPVPDHDYQEQWAQYMETQID